METHKPKEPLFRIAKRDSIVWWKAWGIRAAAILAALVFSGLVAFLLTKENPLKIYATMLDGAFGTQRRIWGLLQNLAMLLCVSVAVTPAFKMRFWNIGAEGQVLVGGLASAACMILLGDQLPNAVLLLVIAAVSILAGALWAVIPAFFRAHWQTNETLFTLMMNYIAIQLVAFFVYKWSVPKGSGQVGVINRATHAGWLPAIGKYDYLLNILIVAVITAFMYIYLKYSKHGYEIAVVGESENTARYIGIPVKKVIIRTMLISGALCGIAGMLLVSGTDHTISRDTAAGRGFTAIMVSWLAKFNPVFMVLTSFLIVFLQKGATEISTAFALNESFSEIITGIIIFFIIGCEFFIQYTVRFREKEAAK
ncbi:MAG: ABC transporter permease [Oscillospiraceae bacterium]|nr:ABC transporter permease [Oscillospiraceae bacterium]MCR4760651.1 ABC transporter permease [Oscillospiraceae bacterium]